LSGEYLLFNILVLAGPLALALRHPQILGGRWGHAALGIVVLGLPYLVWDSWVTGRHWEFNPSYVLAVRIAKMPISEILFFVTVPFACLFTWRSVFVHWPERVWPALRIAYPLLWACGLLGAFLFVRGREYTGLTLMALAIVAFWDSRTTRLLLQPRFLAFCGAVIGFTSIFNGYLTARPVVLYGAQYQLDFRIVTIPIEDFGYGLALVWGVISVFEHAGSRERKRGLVARFMERRFGGYHHRIDRANSSLPRDVSGERRVAVVGAGIAGLTAAIALAERRFRVTLFEANPYLGGKIGAWTTTLPDGEQMGVEHGFHAFFRHYYNLNELMERVGVARHMVPIEDYLIFAQDGKRYGFQNVSSTPLVNLLSMARHGIYRIRDVALGPSGREMETFFRYDVDRTFEEFDGISFQEFADRAKLPKSLRLVFKTFSRAFFADSRRLSMAELIKSFHSFYLSHDHGLIYDYPDGDYGTTVLGPIREHLEKYGADIRLGHPIESLERSGECFRVAGEDFDHVVLATPAKAARDVLGRSNFVAEEAPEFARKASNLKCGQRYAMLRLWMDRDVRADVPVFVITEKFKALDSVSVYHRIERESAEWVRRNGGGIFELHCYAVPDELTTNAEVRAAFLEELPFFFPELRDAEIRHEVLQVRDDFTAHHVGMWADRPATDTGIPGLTLAGDWVKLPCPAMLMEAACTAGLLSANVILSREGLCEAPVHTVPLKGLLAQR